MVAKYCRSKNEALKAFQELWDEDPEYSVNKYGEQIISMLKIESVRYYTHLACDTQTMTDPVCWACGEICGTTGRHAFMILF